MTIKDLIKAFTPSNGVKAITVRATDNNNLKTQIMAFDGNKLPITPLTESGFIACNQAQVNTFDIHMTTYVADNIEETYATIYVNITM